MKFKLSSSAKKCIIIVLILNLGDFVSAAINFANYNNTSNGFKITEDAYLTAPELIKKYGYPVETHNKVITEDGHILTLHRIPYGIKSGPAKNKPVVYIQVGFISNSADPILTGPENALGYFMADAGYDVWLGNTRGSRYSTHSFGRSHRKYWDYSWSDIGYYDIPAMIDYILKTAKQESLYYIGHSRGTTSFFVMCSEKPEYNKKIRTMVGLAPVAYMSHVPNPIFQLLAHNIHTVMPLLNALNINHISLNNTFLLELCKSLHSTNIVNPGICTIVTFLLGGFDFENFNVTNLPTFIGHLPDSLSIKELSHYGQIILSGKFHNYNYGPSVNLLKYNTVEPPEYDLSKVKTPVVLFYSANDMQSSAIDAEKSYQELGNPVAKYFLSEGPSHFSYLNGLNMKNIVYNKILNEFKKY